mmetsp:Transcript_128774/g.294016  ORF Transcript_128774/g.294016 Transcript_128774/m.294016 type:complete len:473 (+) Transcript_128774:16-1434(+)
MLPRTAYSRAAVRPLATSRRSHHIAVVGSGPAGFYTTKYILKSMPQAKVHLYERLPVPFGLVRWGVAPDHPEVKNVADDFHSVATTYSDRFQFFGNTTVGDAPGAQGGPAVALEDLRRGYDGVVLAYGAEADTRLNLPGEEGPGVLTAREFVLWYNGHPDFSHLKVDLSRVQEAVVIGQGNVALDVARVLLRSPAELAKTDITAHAVAALETSAVKKVTVLGRRGAAQAAFTNKELRELTRDPAFTAALDPANLEACLNEASQKEIASSRPRKRTMDILQGMAKQWESRDTADRVLEIAFLRSPVGYERGPDGVTGLRVAHTRLAGQPGSQRAMVTEQEEVLGAQMVVQSVGFKVTPIPGVPFERGAVVRRGAVVLDREDQLAPVFSAGWLKRGPTGVIATNIPDAQETADAVVRIVGGGPAAAPGLAQPAGAVSFEGWLRIRAEEERRGAVKGKPAEKVVTRGEMLSLAAA